jgi:hypothetical protein
MRCATKKYFQLQVVRSLTVEFYAKDPNLHGTHSIDRGIMMGEIYKNLNQYSQVAIKLFNYY